MTDEQIEKTAQAFGDAAKLVKEAGFDMVLIHGGHGWLLGQFASPYFKPKNRQMGRKPGKPYALLSSRDRKKYGKRGPQLPDRIPYER